MTLHPQQPQSTGFARLSLVAGKGCLPFIGDFVAALDGAQRPRLRGELAQSTGNERVGATGRKVS